MSIRKKFRQKIRSAALSVFVKNNQKIKIMIHEY